MHSTSQRLMSRLAALAALLLALPATAQDTLLIESVPTYSAGMGRADGPFTLLSLRDGSLVVAPDASSRADSASTTWDLGLRGTEVILNGGESGPGGLTGVLVPMAFESVLALPEALVADGEGECPRGAARVVCNGSGNGWYEYASNGVQPLPDQTLVIRRPDGSAAKVRFLSYFLGGALPSGVRPRYVTLEVQPLGAEGR